MNSYGIEDIESLSFKDGVRARIPMYLGTDDTEGIYQALKEGVNNSTDEALMGFGNKIIITVNEKENTVSIKDEGRGIPFGIREDGENVLVSIFSRSHTGGKFNNKNYTMVSGLNGIGIKATCLSSEFFEGISYREGKQAKVYFKKGNLISYEECKSENPNLHGTYIKFKPDKEVFKNMTEGFTFKKICENIKMTSYLTRGITFVVYDEISKKKIEYCSENGIADFIKENVNKPLMNMPIIANAKDNTDEVEIAFMWTGDPTQEYVFVNGLICEQGGSPVTGAKTKITTKIKALSGKSFDPELIRKGLVFAINCKVANPSFANQTKSKINNPNLRTLASEAFDKGLSEFANLPEYAALIESLEKFQKAEKAADAIREKILNAAKEVSEMRTKKGMILNKVSDAKVLGENSRLLICEGKSASGSAKKGRDKDLHGIFEARGKIINGLSCSEDKFLDNDEIKQLQVAVGFDYGKLFNPKKARYGYIDFFVDPDVDGLHIFLLGLVAIWKICPDFVRQGRVGWFHAPLFIVENKGKQTYFYTDEDYNERGRKLPGNVRRVKGLGLLEKRELREAIFDCPEAHEVFEYTPEAMEALEALMGADVGPKKEFIFENIDFSKYGEM